MSLWYFNTSLIGFYEDYINETVLVPLSTGWSSDTNLKWAFATKEEVSAQLIAGLLLVLDQSTSDGHPYSYYGAFSVTQTGDLEEIFPSPEEIGTYNWPTGSRAWRMPLAYSWYDATGHHTNASFYTSANYFYVSAIPTTYDFSTYSQDPDNHDDPYYLDMPVDELPTIIFDTILPLEIPIDGSHEFQLALQDTGKWIPKEGEPYPLKYKKGVNVVKVKFDGGRNGIIRTSRDGGFLIYEVNGSGNAIGLIRVFRYNRTLAAVITPELLPVYLPRTV